MADRYFTTNAPGYLYYFWDGSQMWVVDSTFPEGGRDLACGEDHPDKLNQLHGGLHGDLDPKDPMYVYETNEKWERI